MTKGIYFFVYVIVVLLFTNFFFFICEPKENLREDVGNVQLAEKMWSKAGICSLFEKFFRIWKNVNIAVSRQAG